MECVSKSTRYEQLLDLKSMKNEIFFDFKQFSARMNGLAFDSSLHSLCVVGAFSVAPVLKNAKAVIERFSCFSMMIRVQCFV